MTFAGRFRSRPCTIATASAERCPIFPGVTTRPNWSFADPSTFTGTEYERSRQIVAVRDEIRGKIEEWVKEEGNQRLYRTR